MIEYTYKAWKQIYLLTFMLSLFWNLIFTKNTWVEQIFIDTYSQYLQNAQSMYSHGNIIKIQKGKK